MTPGAPCEHFWLLHRDLEGLPTVCAGLPSGCTGRGWDAEAQVGSLFSTSKGGP